MVKEGEDEGGHDKGKHSFIKDNIPTDVHTIGRDMETLVAFMQRAVTKEDTLLGAKLELTIIVWAEMGPASTPKDFEEGIVWCFT